MIDGIQIKILLQEFEAIKLIRDLDLKYSHKKNSHERYFHYIGTIGSLLLEIYFKEGKFYLTLRGSLQKFWWGDNKGDFRLPEIEKAIKKIYRSVNMDIVELNGKRLKKITQLSLVPNRIEFGVNMEIGIDNIKAFLETNLIQHRKRPFLKIDDDLVYRCRHDNYHLKIYQKGENLLRVEIVFLSDELRKMKIKKLEDISHEKLVLMGNRLKKEFREVILSDGINIHSCESISKKEEIQLLRFTSQWRHKCFTEDMSRATPKERRNMRQKAWRLGVTSKKIIKEKGAGYKEVLAEILDQKIESLLQQKCRQFPLGERR